MCEVMLFNPHHPPHSLFYFFATFYWHLRFFLFFLSLLQSGHTCVQLYMKWFHGEFTVSVCWTVSLTPTPPSTHLPFISLSRFAVLSLCGPRPRHMHTYLYGWVISILRVIYLIWPSQEWFVFWVGERRFLFIGESGGENRFCSAKVGLRLAHLLAHLVNQGRIGVRTREMSFKNQNV